MDHRIRLDWARQHIQDIDREICSFLGSGPYSMWIRYDEERARYAVRLRVCKEIPRQRWSLMAGDALHGLRSALDSLAFALCVSDLGREPLESEALRIQFVIADSPAHWEKERERRAKHLPISDKLWTAFERTQPYHRRQNGLRPYLLGIRDLSNHDKHRRINVVDEATTDAGVTVTDEIGNSMAVAGWRGRLIDKTDIVVFDVRDGAGNPLPRHAHPCMNVRGHLAFDVLFQKGPPGRSAPVTGWLRGAADHIEHNIFRWLEPLLW